MQEYLGKINLSTIFIHDQTSFLLEFQQEYNVTVCAIKKN